MKERPILFSAPMVRALLDGSKSQTRRIVKPQPPLGHNWAGWCVSSTHTADEGKATWAAGEGALMRDAHRVRCPYGQPGDRLWVRETWQYADWTQDGLPWVGYSADASKQIAWAVQHDSDGWGERLTDIWADLSRPENYAIDNRAADRRWRPSIHMPRWASRILLEIVSARVERLGDISEADALAEGISLMNGRYTFNGGLHESRTAVDSYRALWESINGAGSWDANLFVWTITFRRLP